MNCTWDAIGGRRLYCAGSLPFDEWQHHVKEGAMDLSWDQCIRSDSQFVIYILYLYNEWPGTMSRKGLQILREMQSQKCSDQCIIERLYFPDEHTAPCQGRGYELYLRCKREASASSISFPLLMNENDPSCKWEYGRQHILLPYNGDWEKSQYSSQVQYWLIKILMLPLYILRERLCLPQFKWDIQMTHACSLATTRLPISHLHLLLTSQKVWQMWLVESNNPNFLNPFSNVPVLQIPLFFTCSNMQLQLHMQLPPGRSKRCTRIFNNESTRRPPSIWPQAE
jgi:hypothetical protein